MKKKLLILFLLATGCLLSVPDTIISQAAAQGVKEISGVVKEENGSPIAGATVVIKGSTRGVLTGLDGDFKISASQGDILETSFLGFTTSETTVGSETFYQIILSSRANEMEEVTVVAFAKQKKESVISSISTVKPSELKVPSSNLTTAMAGRMSGMIAYQRSGEPGQDNADFFIRGVTTFGYKTDPLILIDNVELSTDDLARLNVDDIATFSIMKDATATALYGARGANGVILVTTKEGREGSAQVSLRLENSFSAPVSMVKLADPVTFMELHNEAVRTRNPLGATPYSQSHIDNVKAGTNPYYYPAEDWYGDMFKNYSVNQRGNLSVSGGGKVARYYIAGSYDRDNGMLNVDKRNDFNSNIKLQKYSVRSNININLTKSTEAIVRFQGNFDDYTGPIDGGTDLFHKAMRTAPTLFPKYYPSETSNHIMFGNYADGAYVNPYADMVKGYKDSNRSLVLAQGELKQDFGFITEGLNARALISTTRFSYSDVSRFYNPFYYQATNYDRETDTYSLVAINPTGGSEELTYNEGQKNIVTTNYMEAAVSYNRQFGNNDVSGMLVFTRRTEQKSNANTLQKSLPYKNQGLSGRFTYSYGSRYFGEFNFGYNGSERFHEKERYGFFPSIGLGYIISNEDFWEPVKDKLSKLKFKFTYGLVGNDAIGGEDDRFFYLSELNMNDGGKGQDFGTNWGYHSNGITTTRYANQLITWEKAKKMNIGLELNLFNQIEIQADFFTERRNSILMERSFIPTTMGLQSAVKANIGEAAARGMDISVDYNHYFNKDLWLTARGNFTYATSEYKVVEEPDYASQGTPWRSQVGQSLRQRWGYIAERLFIDEYDILNSPEQNFGKYMAGDIKYKDIDGDGKITEADMVPIGFPTVPEITYGFGFSLGYKSFDVSMFFQGNARVSFWVNPRSISPFIDTWDANDWQKAERSQNQLLHKIATNHWSESNRDSYAFWPRLANEDIDNNYQSSTWWMCNGAFMRLKSVEIGYTLPKKVVKKVGIENLRIYLSGTNLFVLSKFNLWDPEMGDNGLGYPIQRVFNIGLNLNF